MSKKAQGKVGLWSPLLICIIGMNLCVSIISLSINSGSPLYIQKIGEPSIYGGMLIAVFAVTTIAARIVSGALVDRFSRQSVMLAGAFSIFFGSALPLFIPSLVTQAISRVFQGIGFALIHTAINSATADILPKERLGEGIGYAALGQALGMACGPSIALWFTSFEYAEALSAGLTAMATIAFVLAMFVRYEKKPASLPPTSGYRRAWERRKAATEAAGEENVAKAANAESAASTLGAPNTVKPANAERAGNAPATVDVAKSQPREAPKGLNRFFEKAALWPSIPMFFMALGLSVFFTYTTVFAREMEYQNPSLFFVVAAICAIFTRIALAKNLDATGMRSLVFIPALFGAAALLGICFIRIEVAFWLMGIGYGISVGLALPLYNALVMKNVHPSRYGPASALFYLMYDVGIGIAALLWGLMIDLVGFEVVFVGGAVSLIFALVLSLRIFSKRKREKQAS